MKIKSLVLMGLLSASGPALAQYSQLEPVEVRPVVVFPDSHAALSFDCANLRSPSPTDVESVLKINDRTETQRLSNKLMGAIAEACAAGITHIVVQRSQEGHSLTWYPADDYYSDVAYYDNG
jgi:hypothetical protein